MWVRLIGEGARILQLMILLSALLASLTGLMVGEGHVAPAQVEVSATSDIADPNPAVLAAVAAPAASPTFGLNRSVAPEVATSAPLTIRDGRFHLDMKQSWLI